MSLITELLGAPMGLIQSLTPLGSRLLLLGRRGIEVFAT